MKYMGSKSRIAKYIVPIIQSYIDNHNIKTYVEPFCGGCNIIDKIKAERKIACDKQKYLIALYNNLDKVSLLPDFVTREHYSEVRDCYNKGLATYPDWYIGAIGFLSSYNGRFFDGGYSGIVHTKANTERNYYDEAKRNFEVQLPFLKDIEFYEGDYVELCSNAKDTLIYCDPPYKGVKQYGSSINFNHEKFWEWCRTMSKNNIVLISEHSAPSDFKYIWSMPIQRTIDNNKRVKSIEKLFTYEE